MQVYRQGYSAQQAAAAMGAACAGAGARKETITLQHEIITLQYELACLALQAPIHGLRAVMQLHEGNQYSHALISAVNTHSFMLSLQTTHILDSSAVTVIAFL